MPITAAEFAERARVAHGLPEFRTYGPDVPDEIRRAWNLCIRLGQAQARLRIAAAEVSAHVSAVIEADRNGESTAPGHNLMEAFNTAAFQVNVCRDDLNKVAREVVSATP